MQIRRLNSNEPLPMHLLLSADPSEAMINGYLTTGQCYIAEAEFQDSGPYEEHGQFEERGQFEELGPKRRGESAVIGVYILLPTKPTTIEVVNIAVAVDHQNKGIGRQLLNHAIQNAQSQGYKTIEIGTGNSSIGQLALYQKCGFRITAIDTDFFINNYHQEIYENGIQCRDLIRLSLSLQT